MGIFQKKQSDEELNGPLHFFDDYFREDLRNKAREYFEKAIDDNVLLFKKDLETTVEHINNDLNQRISTQLDGAIKQINADITRQIDEQFVEYGKAMKEAQDVAITSIQEREKALEENHQQLSDALQKSIASQDQMLVATYKENAAKIAQMNQAQALALQMLNQSVQSFQQQQQQLGATMQEAVAKQEAMLLGAFEENMAQIVEHYILGALGEQFDLKAQLPGIIQQMETNKKTIVEDMTL